MIEWSLGKETNNHQQDNAMIQQGNLTAQDSRDLVQTISQAHLGLEANGYITNSAMLYDVLMKAASENISIDAACRDLETSASGNTIRELLNQQITVEALKEHETAINEALADRLPHKLLRQPIQAAIDEHDEPFYGKTSEVQKYTCRAKAKDGTTHFFRIITLYVIDRQMRWTVAVAFVRPEDERLAIVQRLLQRAKTLGLRFSVLYLDRGFCSGAIIGYLQKRRQPAVIACPIRGKTGGTRQLCCGRKSYRTAYTFTDGTAADLVVVASHVPGKNKKRRRKWLLFVVIALDWTAQTVYRRYRTRFGIESSYRILRRVRVKTTSRNPALRFFLLGFALLLVNLWALIRWLVARIPGRGPYRLDPIRFQFHTFVCFIRRAVEQLYGVLISVPYSCQTLKS